MIRTGIALVASAWSAATSAPSGGEYLGQAPIPGFVVAHSVEREGNYIEERVPAGENVNVWTRMITIQRFAGVAGRTSAAAFLENLRTNLLPRSCPGASSSAIGSASVSGRRAARVRVDCPLNPGTGRPETFLMLAIEGSNDLHVAQVAFRSMPSGQDVAWAERQLASVVVCGSASRDEDCSLR